MGDLIQITALTKEVQRDLKKLYDKTVTLTPVMRQIAGIMHDSVEQNFEDEGRPGKWKALAEITIEKRREKGHWPGKILQVKGQLAASISTSYGRDFAAVGTNKVYAAIHQFGGDAGRGKKVKIPARPYLVITERELREIGDLVKMYLERV